MPSSKIPTPLRKMFDGCALLDLAITSVREEEAYHAQDTDRRTNILPGFEAVNVLHAYGHDFMPDGSPISPDMHQACMIAMDPLPGATAPYQRAFTPEAFEIAANVLDCLSGDPGHFMFNPYYHQRETLGVIMAIYIHYMRRLDNNVINAITHNHPDDIANWFATDQEADEETEDRIRRIADDCEISRAFDTTLGRQYRLEYDAALERLCSCEVGNAMPQMPSLIYLENVR